MKRLLGWIGLCFVLLTVSVVLARKAAILPPFNLQGVVSGDTTLFPISAAADQMEITITAGRSLHVGDLIKINSEWMIVRSVAAIAAEENPCQLVSCQPWSFDMVALERGRFGTEISSHKDATPILVLPGT